MNPGDKANILLVDDQPQKLVSYEAALASLGENLLKANSGTQALQILLREEIAVVLLDVHMPVMDGFETAAMVRQHPRFQDIPIIFVTGVNTTDLDRLKGYGLGAVDYVFVPVIPEILRAKVAVFVELHRKTRELQTLNETLEKRVAERTVALERQAQELRELNTALVKSNQDLDEFAYVASHDLKEPLRGIHNFAGFLIEDYGEKLDYDGRAKLETLKGLTRRLEELTDTLLEFSRVGRLELAIQPTDLNEVVGQILDSLRITIQERNVDVRIPQPLPILRCDRVRVGEVFRNLITNALKYNDKAEKWIEIGWTRNTNGSPIPSPLGEKRGDNGQAAQVFFIRDNGIGIPPKHFGAIFRIFKRLHSRDKYGGGTGAGLTIVKKIIECHGGRIWLESRPGEGSTFFFTLEGEADKS